jgi:hypothetical protein
MEITTQNQEIVRHGIANGSNGSPINPAPGEQWRYLLTSSAMLKQQRVGLVEAQQGLKIFNAIPLRFVRVDLNNAISIAYETKTYAYDAYFLDCAVRHAAPLLTLDLALERAALKLGVKVMEV